MIPCCLILLSKSKGMFRTGNAALKTRTKEKPHFKSKTCYSFDSELLQTALNCCTNTKCQWTREESNAWLLLHLGGAGSFLYKGVVLVRMSVWVWETLLDTSPPNLMSTVRRAPCLKHSDTLICLTILQVRRRQPSVSNTSRYTKSHSSSRLNLKHLISL